MTLFELIMIVWSL